MNDEPVYRPMSVGFEDADNNTETSFHLQPNGWVQVTMSEGGSRFPSGRTEVHLDDLIDCLQELKRRASEDEEE